MSNGRSEIRQQKLLRSIRKAHVDALLVTNPTNVTYLTGFSGDSSFLLVGHDLRILISDSRYSVQIDEECPGLDTYIRKNTQPILSAVAEIVKKAKLQKLGFESHVTSFDQWERLNEQIKQLILVPLSSPVEDLRMIKDAHEIAEIKAAILQAERGIAVTTTSLLGSMTELETAHNLEHSMRRFGAARASFDPIVAVGPRAALPHARPGNNVSIASSNFLLVDWGAETQEGYKSDLTRVFVTAKILPKLEKIYRVVLKAQRQGLAAIRPGVCCCDVDIAARNVIEESGYGKNFGHGIGHGIGLDIHEEPRMNASSKTILKPGMIITVEPGVYLPGWGGVRIEDDVLVTRDGHQVLTTVPKEFEDTVLN